MGQHIQECLKRWFFGLGRGGGILENNSIRWYCYWVRKWLIWRTYLLHFDFSLHLRWLLSVTDVILPVIFRKSRKTLGYSIIVFQINTLLILRIDHYGYAYLRDTIIFMSKLLDNLIHTFNSSWKTKNEKESRTESKIGMKYSQTKYETKAIN